MEIVKAFFKASIEVTPYPACEQLMLELSCELAHMNQGRDADIHILTSPMRCGRSLFQIALEDESGIEEAKRLIRAAVAA